MVHRVNQEHIARHLGISQATVSRALHGGSISEDARRRILEACEQLGYHMHHNAHSLASGRTGNLIYAIQDFNDLSGEMTHNHLIAAGKVALANKYKLSIDTVDRVPELAASRYMDGALVAIYSPNSYPEFIEWVRSTDFPVVLVDVPLDEPGIANVRVDNYQASYDLTAHMLALGHRNLVYFGHVRSSPISQDRYAGFLAAAETVGNTQTKAVDIKGWVSRPETVFALRDQLEAMCPFPTAFIASSDACAAGLVQVVESMGLRVPQDVSVCGFDNAAWSGGIKPPLTTMDLQSHKVGQVATETLLRMLTGKTRRTVRRIPARLVERQSCMQVKETLAV